MTFTGNILYVWNSFLRTSVLIPRADASSVTVFDVKQNLVKFQDENGKLIDNKQLPDYPGLAPHCEPGDQAAHVYDPERLKVLNLCSRISGIVKKYESDDDGGSDGDFTFDVALDPEFKNFVNAENSKVWNGNIHVEIVCYNNGRFFAFDECRDFPESLRVEPPKIGEHIWMEGQWVEDWGHSGWTELHPLFRWEPYK